ncbi:META domain-containing protein [Castellaniella sp. WN]
MFAVSVLALAVGACAQTPTDSASGAPTGTAVRAAPSLDGATLSAYDWRLADAVDRQGRPIAALRTGLERPLRLSFSDTSLNVQGGCNAQFGGYALESGALRIEGLAATMKACAPELMQLDAGIAARLKGRPAARIEGGAEAPRLVLTTAGGDVLAFTGVPTPEARYGSPGEIVFLEIAPERVVCSHPLIPDQRCLRVRERRYDAVGLPQPPAADWQPLYEPIEGYEHRDGEHAIVRAKRFTDPHPPADRSARVYILDMVVQRGG